MFLQAKSPGSPCLQACLSVTMTARSAGGSVLLSGVDSALPPRFLSR